MTILNVYMETTIAVIFAYDSTHLTSGIVTALPWEIKKSFFADIQQMRKKMQTNFGVQNMESFSIPP